MVVWVVMKWCLQSRVCFSGYFWGCRSSCIFLWGICFDGHNKSLEAYIWEKFAFNHVSFSRGTFILDYIGKSLAIVVLIIRCIYRIFFNCKEILSSVAMKNLSRMPGTASSLMLHIGQLMFAKMQLLLWWLAIIFANYTTFWILLQCQLVYLRNPISRGNWLIIMNLDMGWFSFSTNLKY